MNRPRESVVPLVEQLSETNRATAYETPDVAQEQIGPQSSSLESVEIAWLLWKQRSALVRLTTWGAIFFTVLAFAWPKWYTATTSLMPPDFNTSSALAMAATSMGGSGESGSGGVGGGGSIMGLANQLLGLNSSGDLYAGVLQSRTIEDEIIEQFGLMKVYSERYPEDTRKKLETLTEVTQDTKTGILTISFTDKSPSRAADVARAYVEDLNQILAKENTSSAHRERVFIEQRLAQVKQEMNASAKNFSEFASANTAIDIPEQAKAMVAAAADLQAQLVASQSMLTGLQQVYTDDNVHVKQMKAQVAELQAQLNELGGKNVNPFGGPTLPKGELYPSIRELPLLGVKYLDLYRENKINEAVYELLTKQYEVAKIEEARDVPSVQVLDLAVVPQKKAGPHRLYIIIGGTFFTLALGAIWIVGGTWWEGTNPRDPWRIFTEEVCRTASARTWDSRAGLWIRALASRARKSFRASHQDTTHKNTPE